MRCPKCSFFSFDDLATCAKCSKDLSAVIAELHGTCTEVVAPFFLSSVVQSPEVEERTFSDSDSEAQASPPTTDDTDISFDDTLTGGGVSLSTDDDETMLSGFDENIETSDDEISLELGDIMPMDLDQLDEPISLEGDSAVEAIDLNFTDDVSDQNAEFDTTEILSTDAFEDDVDLDLTGDFDAGVGLDLSEDFGSFDLDEAGISLEPVSDNGATLSEGEKLDLDEDLLATLTGDFPALNTEGIEDIELDDSLLDELETGSVGDQLSADIGDDLADFDLDETSIALEPISTTESFNADDTLTLADLPQEELAFDMEDEDEELLGDELLATADEDLDLDLAELDSDQPDAELTLGDSPLEELAFDTEDEEKPGGELLATADEDLDLDLAGLGSDQPDAELTLGDSPLEELAFDTEDEEQTGDELLTTADEDLDLDLVGLGSDQPEAEQTLGDSPLEELAFDTEDEEQTGDELLATADEDLDLDLVGLGSDQPEEELTLGDSPLEELAFDTEDEEQTGDELPATADADLDLDLVGPGSDQPAAEQTLDDSRLAELTFDTGDAEQLGDELLATMDEELDLDLVGLDPDQPDEELALDDSPLEGHEPSKLPSLGLEEIDVSDLLSPPEDASRSSLEDDEIDLTSLMEEDAESDDSDLDLLDEDIPEIEIIGD